MASRRQRVEFEISARDRASRVLASVGRGLRRFTSSVAAAGAAIAAFLGVAVRNTSRELRTLDQVADQTGTSVDDIAQRVAALRLRGADADDFADALNELNVKTQEARGLDENVLDSFERLGVSFQDLDRNDPLALFDQIQRNLNPQNIRDAGAALDQIFGGDLARRLIPILRLTAQEYGSLMREAVESGATDGLEAAVGQQRQLDLEIQKLGNELQVLTQELVPVMRALTQVATEILQFVKQREPTGNRAVDFVTSRGDDSTLGTVLFDAVNSIARYTELLDEIERNQRARELRNR